MTPDRLLRWLLSFPFPGAVSAMQGDELTITLEGEVLRFDGAWRAPDGQRIACTLPDVSSADDIHAEIRRGLAIARGITGASWHNVTPEPAPSWEEVKERCVGPDRPGDDTPQDRDTRIRALEVERARLLISEDTLSKIAAAIAIPALEPYDDALSMVKRLVDGYAVVSQRLVGAQKEVAEVSAERDDATARADRLAAQNDAAHEVIDDARCAPRMSALGLSLTLFDRVSAVMQQRRRDDDLRSAIAVAVGLDRSASLALILDTVTRDRPGREISRLSGLLDVTGAPVTFGERHLSTAERAEWVLRRWLAEGKECSARMAQLIDAEVLLDCMGVPAYAAVPSDDPGDASEALTVAERLRLHFGAQS